MRNCLDDYLGQILCDKDGVVDLGIVLIEMPLIRFKEYWPLPTESLPQHSKPNPNLLANQLWCIDFLTPRTPLIIPHRLPAFLESLMPLKNDTFMPLLCCSKSNLKYCIRFCGIFFSKFKT